MTAELEALARRAVACKGWRWMAGMLAVPAGPEHDADCRSLGADRLRLVEEWAACGPVEAADGWLPDLTDPATLGCLLALVRAAGGDSTLHLQPYSTFDSKVGEQRVWWRLCSVRRFPSPGMPAFDVIMVNQRTYLAGPTEAAALVAALEATP